MSSNVKSASKSASGDQGWAQAKGRLGLLLTREREEREWAQTQRDKLLAQMESRGELGALMKACVLDDMAGAQSALARGAPIDGVDGHGDSALRVCAHLGRHGMMQFLIQQGASVELRGHNGDTALDAAIDQNDIEGAEILLLSGARVDSRSIVVVKIGPRPCSCDAILNAALPETPDPWGAIPPRSLPAFVIDESIRGEQPLARAASLFLNAAGEDEDRASQPMIRLLLSMGADPNDTDGFGCSAVMKAIFADDIAASWSLVQAGADPEAKDAAGRTAAEFRDSDYWTRDEVEDEFQDAIESREASSEAPVV